ncbi:hypothetical protein PVT67_16160 [Gallaecimonas kandeliae]|uniref:hypothetical protein n=1 Tax=Gallaecimonas kandeliae TaxID=3029055 RepID=UPI0026487DCE|nr:hypothetical protein [Gallaecimonas kandeliae]WKE65177.1 hypothetical protein PVT67_16160 [Gallaecimonas kandeliae]
MKKVSLLAGLAAVIFANSSVAGVDRVYDPYVEQGEKEVEVRGVHNLTGDTFHEVKMGGGYGVNSHWFVEGYLNAQKENDGGDLKIKEAELESKFQLSEQGEYWADFGMLVELERSLEHDVWELRTGPVMQKQFGDFVATANIMFEKTFGGEEEESEMETQGAFQLKYRLSEALEPALEYYTDDDTQALGPVLLGANRLGQNKVKWELGVLFGMDKKTEDATLRWQVEYEF